MDPSNTTPVESNTEASGMASEAAVAVSPATSANPGGMATSGVPAASVPPEAPLASIAPEAPASSSATPEASNASGVLAAPGLSTTPEGSMSSPESINNTNAATSSESTSPTDSVTLSESVNAAKVPDVAVSVAAPVNTDVANAALNPPVNPVVNPTTPQADGALVAGTMPMSQMFQTQPAARTDVFAETTAIAVPEGPKAPDPIEEELKAPLKAAGPVPGSIGSAMSMPTADGVSANGAPVDSATNSMTVTPTVPTAADANSTNPMTANMAAPMAKKTSIFDKLTANSKMDKKTLIILCAVAGVILVALIIVLILVATGAI